ncbi:MAG: hypothetical protein K2J55_07000, partial [Eubacterium sp.]|nr:hypothetical protein [Eubacterium sp.]
MRKILATLLTFVLVMSASITAFGATKNDVDKTLESSLKFAYGDKKSFDVSESKDYYLYLCAGGSDEKIKESYLNSVKKALDGGEKFDVGTLALIINSIKLSHENPTDFKGYNLVDLFGKTELGEFDNLYTYMYASDIALLFNFETLEKKLCDAMVSKYTKGVGTDFWGGWGTSPDDLSVFIITLSVCNEDYKDYIDDAVALLKSYNTEAGYDNYGANANSTAMALAAYASIDEKELADDAYNKLMLFYNKETGGFNSNYDDVLATKDAIYGLSNYRSLADTDDTSDKEEKPTNPIVSIKDKNDTNNEKKENEARPPEK